MFSSSKIKELIWKYQIVLACSATAVAAYVIVQDVNAKNALTDMAVSLGVLSDENSTLYDFLENKNLRDEFVEFAKNRSNEA